ncbi:MAG: alpha-amylase family glycosyl hydrolase [Verrucomicrobium sp.]
MAPGSEAPRVEGMGAILTEQGVAFRVWAPHADSVSVIGTFNDFNPEASPLGKEDGGYWYGLVAEAQAGAEYKYCIRNGEQVLRRIDPYARQVTNSVGNGVVYEDTFDWGDDSFRLAPWNELIVYELHIGTFARTEEGKPGSFDDAIKKLPYLKALGINAVEVMPIAEFAGDLSWGYNPAHIFSVETAYGGPDAFKRFVKAAHGLGIGVILDVVYNHFGPSDLDIWQFDGWSENSKGGIYFYNDWRSTTPWGDTRPDYGRGEVRQYIHDNAMMWLADYRVDGLRYDMTLYMRSVSGNGGDDIPEGWSLAQWINRDVAARFPGKITIAEDLRGNAHLTRHESEGGANFSSQWDDRFVHPIRAAIITADDAHRDMDSVKNALLHRYGGDAFTRVVYTESHDEVANGKARVISEVDSENPEGWYALKRSTLGAGLVLTSAGIPMLFQGQTALEDGWFQDTAPLNWSNVRRFSGVARLYRDLISLRLNREGVSKGLTGQHTAVHHVNQAGKVIAYLRTAEGGPGDSTLVVANFSATGWDAYDVGVPVAGKWACRFNSDWGGYRQDLENFTVLDVEAVEEERDGLPARATVAVAPYSLSIYSLDS